MLFEEFTKLVETEVRERVGSRAKVSLDNVRKNNGVMLTAIHISEGKGSICPTIYLNDYYKYFKEGMQMEDIIRDILRTNRKHQGKQKSDVTAFLELSKIRHAFACKLIHYKKNEELLKDVPHVPFLDLAIVFYCSLELEDFGRASILIHNSHLKSWKITEEELVRMAMENAPKILPCEITSMVDIVCQMMSEELFVKQMSELEHPPLYVLTNSQGYFGASAMLYPDVLADFAAEKGKNLIIIPSSVHEVLLIPVEDASRKEWFDGMVQEANELHVEPEEVLADHVYYYNRETGETVIP